MAQKNDTFEYSYSAKEQQEVQKIREKYIPKETDKMEQLRSLDAGATKPGTIAALITGIAGTFLLGIGMCCTMVWAQQYFVPGILIGGIGLAGIAAAYPIYMRITKKERRKLAPEILRLTDELSK